MKNQAFSPEEVAQVLEASARLRAVTKKDRQRAWKALAQLLEAEALRWHLSRPYPASEHAWACARAQVLLDAAAETSRVKSAGAVKRNRSVSERFHDQIRAARDLLLASIVNEPRPRWRPTAKRVQLFIERYPKPTGFDEPPDLKTIRAALKIK